MDLCEHQGKEILGRLGLTTPASVLVQLGDPDVGRWNWKRQETLIKSQLPTGRRGKGGGIVVATQESIKKGILHLLGSVLVSSDGKNWKVESVLLEKKVWIEGEMFLSLLVDRNKGTITFLMSPLGGMDIESSNQAVVALRSDGITFEKDGVSKVTKDWGLGCSLKKQLGCFVLKILRLFLVVGAQQIEINPLAVSKGSLLIIDTKMRLEADSTPNLQKKGTEEDRTNPNLKRCRPSFILISNRGIGCVVNGAGLALITQDIVLELGGEPLNFMDVGGKASVRKIREAVVGIRHCSSARGLLINILGGIVSCEVVAKGVVSSVRKHTIRILPTAVRLEGTGDWEGRQLLLSTNIRTLFLMVSFGSVVREAIDVQQASHIN
ncbi:succinyl-CoA ligase subunit beta [Candidatus Tremblaya phenacola PAVE]|nr:succinyl-CoA ligase subunit beta [Candidatus Tremblaya phenacola PAVE]